MKLPTPLQTGFTLIEVAVVLVLMALLASVVTLSARGMIGGATKQEVVSGIRSIDAQARRHATRTGNPVRLELDTATNTITLTQPGSSAAPPISRYQLPDGYGLDQAWRWRNGERDARQPLVLLYDAHGVTSTWGVTMTHPRKDEDAVEASTHHANSGGGGGDSLLVLGLTGQTTTWEDDEAAQDMLAQLHRRDTD